MTVGIVIGLVVGGIVAAAWIHHGYAWRNYQNLKAAVPPARDAWLRRLLALAQVLLLFALAAGIAWALAGREQ